MSKQKKLLLTINLIGGFAVLASYAWGLVTHPGSASQMWGSMPQKVIPYLYGFMLLAALGYIAFTVYLIFLLNPDKAQINIRTGYKGFNVLYMLILIPSALWMPLTLAMLANPSNLLWAAIRLVLLLVGVGGLGMLSALLSIQPSTRARTAAFIGGIFFCVQVVILDAFIWPSFFILP